MSYIFVTVITKLLASITCMTFIACGIGDQIQLQGLPCLHTGDIYSECHSSKQGVSGKSCKISI